MRFLLFFTFIFSTNLFLYLPEEDFHLDCRNTWEWLTSPSYKLVVSYSKNEQWLRIYGMDFDYYGNADDVFNKYFQLYEHNKYAIWFFRGQTVLKLNRETLTIRETRGDGTFFGSGLTYCKLISKNRAEVLRKKYEKQYKKSRRGDNKI